MRSLAFVPQNDSDDHGVKRLLFVDLPLTGHWLYLSVENGVVQITEVRSCHTDVIMHARIVKRGNIGRICHLQQQTSD
jgi:hypothetical protein